MQLYLGGVGRLVDDPNLTDSTVVVVLGTDFKAVLPPAVLYAVTLDQIASTPSTSTTTTTTTGVVAPKPPTYLSKQECAP